MDGRRGPEEGDAFGEALLAVLEERTAERVVERDDGLVEFDTFDYFSPPTGELWDWMIPRLGRRVLDIGAGAGRAAMALAKLGHEVVALDVSPGAVEVCRRRGVSQTFLGTVVDLAHTKPEPFDSFIGLGNDLSFLGSRSGAVEFLDTLSAMSQPGANLVGTMLDPSDTDDPLHLAYQRANCAEGRLGGQVRFRVRFQRLATPWYSHLWASREELATLAASAGWAVVETTPGVIYGAELRPVGYWPVRRGLARPAARYRPA
ncbi:MAG: methyltransferase domain-containing protein [Candidatus Dormibacteraceae bacterium]